MEKSALSEMQTCFLVTLSQREIDAIRMELYTLPCGEVLEVGDCFTEIGSSGSAGNQPVSLAHPWVQRYQGLLTVKSEHFNWLYQNWEGRDFVLFDSFSLEDLNEGFVSPAYRAKWEGTRDKSNGYYIAYLRMPNNELFHTRGGSSSSICKGTSLTRWPSST